MDQSTIEIRPLATHAEFRACVALQRETWGSGFIDIVPASILNVSQRVGGVSLGAFDQQQTLLGFVFGLTGIEEGRIVHWSDMLAVRPEARNLGLGRRLKERQRQAVREMGGSVIYWTFDPLMARNAHLNFNKLGARVAEYVEDMYGTTDSVLHGGLPTDRLIVAWPTHDREIDDNLVETHRTYASVDCRLGPVVTDELMAGMAGVAILPHCVRIQIPADAETLVRDAAAEALRWRRSVRCAMHWAIAAGYVVSAFYLDEDEGHGYYLMTRSIRHSGGNGAPTPVAGVRQ